MGLTMPQGDKSAYTDKQKRQAKHIEDSEKDRGVNPEVAERIAWATVNKQDGGGNLSGSGRGESAKKGWETRRKREKSK
jgi:plasmid stabilization system protein ParE